MRKIMIIFAISLFLFYSAGETMAEPPLVILDGQTLVFEDAQPHIQDGRTLVPLRAIFEELGADISWDAESRTVRAEKDESVISLQIGKKKAIKNGKSLLLDVAPCIVDSRTMVPLRFVSESLGAGVEWFENARLISISSQVAEESGKKNKKFALTFDDGPDLLYTPAVLDVLKAYNAKATFFLLGVNMEKHPEVVKRIHDEGHQLGNHSYDHPRLSTLSKEEVYDSQIGKTQKIFEELLGIDPMLYRPPFGAITDEQISYLEVKGYKQVRWSIDSEDWDPEKNAPEKILYRILLDADDGGIVCLHSAEGDRSNTVKALPQIIEKLRGKGYRLCTISELPEEKYHSQEGHP